MDAATSRLDVTTAGATVTALKKALGGTANVVLKDGALKGIDIPGAIRSAQAMLGSKRARSRSRRRRQEDRLQRAHRELRDQERSRAQRGSEGRLAAAALAGAGRHRHRRRTGSDYRQSDDRCNLDRPGRRRICSQVAGVTVPVKISGPFDALKYTVDVAALATEAAKDALQRELERRLGGGKAQARRKARRRRGRAPRAASAAKK